MQKDSRGNGSGSTRARPRRRRSSGRASQAYGYPVRSGQPALREAAQGSRARHGGLAFVSFDETFALDPRAAAAAAGCARARRRRERSLSAAAGFSARARPGCTAWPTSNGATPDNPRVVVCVHGLTRCARDFDFLAAELRAALPRGLPRRRRARRLRLAEEPDGIRRADLRQRHGDADRAPRRWSRVHWVGTSLGGLIGMTIAAMPDSPITRLVLNDVGPVLTAVSLQRIATYLGKCRRCRRSRRPSSSCARSARPSARTPTPNGASSPSTWCAGTPTGRCACTTTRRSRCPSTPRCSGQGRRTVEVTTTRYAARRWCCAASSRTCSRATRRRRWPLRGPRAKLVEIPGVGHAPTLIHAEQIAVVKEFLLGSG